MSPLTWRPSGQRKSAFADVLRSEGGRWKTLFFIKRGGILLYGHYRFHNTQMTRLVPSRLSYTCLYSLRKVSLFCWDVFELRSRFLFPMLHWPTWVTYRICIGRAESVVTGRPLLCTYTPACLPACLPLGRHEWMLNAAFSLLKSEILIAVTIKIVTPRVWSVSAPIYFPCYANSSALKKERAGSSETLLTFYHIVHRHVTGQRCWT